MAIKKKITALVLIAAMTLSSLSIFAAGANADDYSLPQSTDVIKVTIADVLEILKYLAGMESVYTDSGVSPTIGDALELLKDLANMDSNSEDVVENVVKKAKIAKEAKKTEKITDTTSKPTESQSATTTSPYEETAVKSNATFTNATFTEPTGTRSANDTSTDFLTEIVPTYQSVTTSRLTATSETSSATSWRTHTEDDVTCLNCGLRFHAAGGNGLDIPVGYNGICPQCGVKYPGIATTPATSVTTIQSTPVIVTSAITRPPVKNPYVINEPGNNIIEPLSREREERISNDYAAYIYQQLPQIYEMPIDFVYAPPPQTSFPPGSLNLRYYYGTFNGYDILRFGNPFGAATQALVPVEVGGYTLDIMNSGAEWIFAHKDGNFYRVEDAYRQGLLRDEDVRAIHFVYLRKAFVMQYTTFNSSTAYPYEISENRTFDINDVVVMNYYGQYGTNKLPVAVMYIRDWGATCDMQYFNVAGYTFSLGSGSFRLTALYSGAHTRIEQVYEMGLLTGTDIGNLYHDYFVYDGTPIGTATPVTGITVTNTSYSTVDTTSPGEYTVSVTTSRTGSTTGMTTPVYTGTYTTQQTIHPVIDPNHPGNDILPVIDEELKARILKNWEAQVNANKPTDDLRYIIVDDDWFYTYYGSFKGYEVVGLRTGEFGGEMMVPVAINGKIIEYFPATNYGIFFYHTQYGRFFTLDVALGLDLLDDVDVDTLHFRYLREVYADQMNSMRVDTEARRTTADDVVVMRYYGLIGGSPVATMWWRNTAMTGVVRVVTTAGLTFYLSSGDCDISVYYYYGSLVSLEEAYALGYFNDSHIAQLYQLHIRYITVPVD
ncbi:MAG: hypothetical protein FWG83_01925 [Oscillospiraceae bacterium]|nr:hypothetical protein [Oscillospiraceae bacterium]